MSTEAIVASVLIPLCTAVLSFIGVLYSEANKRKRIITDLEIVKNCREIGEVRFADALPMVQENLLRELYSFSKPHSAQYSIIICLLSSIGSLSLFIISGLQIALLVIDDSFGAELVFFLKLFLSLAGGAILLILSIYNALQFTSFRSYSRRLKRYVASLPTLLKSISDIVDELVEDKEELRLAADRLIEDLDSVSRPFKENGNYPEDKILLYPRKFISSLEYKELSIENMREELNSTEETIDEAIQLANESLFMLEGLDKQSKQIVRAEHNASLIRECLKCLRSQKRIVKINELSLSRSQNAIQEALDYLDEAQKRGAFDNQVVIQSELGILLVTDRKSVSKYRLNEFFEQEGWKRFDIFRSHDEDDVAIIAEKTSTASSVVIGFLVPDSKQTRIESMLGLDIPTKCVIHKE